jgi:hypothetical protein
LLERIDPPPASDWPPDERRDVIAQNLLP